MFANNCGPLDYDWWMDDRKLQIEPGRVYYVNTRKTHRTISWVNDSIHLILNIPMTSANVAKVIANLHHTH
jgi:mannose-6-phosphate isomerase-like protein (cupin superfamily)